jgi:hypothetical protein
MMNFGNCERETTQSILVLREHKSRLIVKNSRNEKIKQVRIDGCVVTEGQRCDFLIIGVDNSEYFVELKGCDVDHAIKQLETTIKLLGSKAKSVKRHSIIVSTRCPLSSPKIQKWQIYFWKNFASELTVKNCVCELAVS